MTRATFAVAMVVFFGSAVASAEASQPTNIAPPTTSDPNEKVCQDLTLTGSRLAVRRFCGTRAEWTRRQLEDHQAVEEIQLNPASLREAAPAAIDSWSVRNAVSLVT